MSTRRSVLARALLTQSLSDAVGALADWDPASSGDLDLRVKDAAYKLVELVVYRRRNQPYLHNFGLEPEDTMLLELIIALFDSVKPADITYHELPDREPPATPDPPEVINLVSDDDADLLASTLFDDDLDTPLTPTVIDVDEYFDGFGNDGAVHHAPLGGLHNHNL